MSLKREIEVFDNVGISAETGETDVWDKVIFPETVRGREVDQILKLALKVQPENILDFGCGVGRLTRAWAPYAGSITGIDIAEEMVRLGKELNQDVSNVVLVLNQHADLRGIADSSIELVFSHICLQHMPFNLAAEYIGEFARVVRPGGYTPAYQ